ncbi:transcriptional regulator, TetR family [Cohaesibacter sp. ES.047]|uniref:TetR/AcrR family transcriptional regulator n=1 Tax=Cohaesibacter sp. ES.047 TaxID=1798205 RepID=UPI000BB743F3|nr:TetR/AcrR family transcriptional regulator [Cohaesibacter sp. ES.047]SNY93019.1 transcriptional regulator, TetR family [Cohaesibacter sp. ES.047]
MTNTRSDILGAAKQCFLLYGFRRSSMDDIAQTAGISRSAIYQYFSNKEDIFSHLLDVVIEEAFDAAELARSETNNPHEALACYLVGYMLYYYDLVMTGPHSDELFEQNRSLGVEKSQAARLRLAIRLNSLMGRDQEDEMGTVLVRSAEGIKMLVKSKEELERQLRCLVNLFI